ncbi:hypothetical protein ABEF95_004385 [Exophiala dermatitidis]
MRGCKLMLFRPIPGGKEWIFRFEVFHTKDFESISLEKYMAEAWQWDKQVKERLDGMKKANATALRNLMQYHNFDQAIANIKQLFSDGGRSSSLAPVEDIFQRLGDLAGGVYTLVPVNQSVLDLIWAAVQFVFSSVLRFFDWFDNVTQMLQELTKALPQLNLYNASYATPDVRKALKDIYDDYVDFCITVAEFFNHRTGRSPALWVSLRWKKIRGDYANTLKRLVYHKQTFTSAVYQAGYVDTAPTAGANRYLMMPPSPRSTNRQAPIVVIPFPRNPNFTGRDDILSAVHDILSEIGPQSVTLHGLGGIGKTQIALEYCFRYTSKYSAVLWVSAESEIVIANSYSDIARKLGVGGNEKTARGRIEAVKDWLEANADWLLILDNADSVDLVRNYWPSTQVGSIVVTTQNLDFIDLTTRDITIDQLKEDEGADLVLKNLRRDDSERPSAKLLSEEVGGMPLAISVITGYAFRTNLGAHDVLQTLRQKRPMAEELWNAPVKLYYSKKLDTVWDLALANLTPSAVELLDVLAFLDPDAVPEAIILGRSDVLRLGHDLEIRAARLRQIIYNLRERHLVERDERGGDFFLRIHRSFRRSVLHRLDKNLDQRQRAYDKAFTALRDVFPRIEFTSRTEDRWPLVQKYLPQVLSLQSCYVASEPRITASIEFADLLCDAGTFLWEQNIFKDSMPMLYLAEQICEELVAPDDPNPVFAQVLESIAVYEDLLGSEPRRKSVVTMKKVQELRRDYYDRIPPTSRTQTDEITLCRSWCDTAASLIGLYEVDEAADLYERALAHYRKIGTEQTIPYRFAHMYYDLTWLRVLQKRDSEALECAERSYVLSSQALGKESVWTINFRYMWACALFSVGHLIESLRMHREVLRDRLRILHETMSDTLLSYYMVGTLLYYVGEHEGAEQNLREALKHRARANWHPIEVARTAYRLVLVLHAQQRYDAAYDVEHDPDMFPDEAIPPAIRDGTAVMPEDRMAQYDFEVSIWHGRTEGPCKPVLELPPYPASLGDGDKGEKMGARRPSGGSGSIADGSGGGIGVPIL